MIRDVVPNRIGAYMKGIRKGKNCCNSNYPCNSSIKQSTEPITLKNMALTQIKLNHFEFKKRFLLFCSIT